MSRPSRGPRLALVGSTWQVRWTENGRTRKRSTNTSSKEQAIAFLQSIAASLAPPAIPRPRRRQPELQESAVRDALRAAIGGFPEVLTPIGRIDLLTDHELIEVKHARLWRDAIGQLLAYGHFHPQHKLRLHVFGAWPPGHAAVCRAICGDVIRLTRHRPPQDQNAPTTAPARRSTPSKSAEGAAMDRDGAPTNPQNSAVCS